MDTPQKRLTSRVAFWKMEGWAGSRQCTRLCSHGRCRLLRHVIGRHSAFRAKRGLRSGTWHCQSAITKAKYPLSRILVRAGPSLALSPLVALELPLPKEYKCAPAQTDLSVATVLLFKEAVNSQVYSTSIHKSSGTIATKQDI